MEIVINLAGFNQFLNLPPERMFWVFMGNLGWLIIAISFLVGVSRVYLFYIQKRWGRANKPIILAIDIPRGNEQSPKAAENMFTYLGGAHATQNFFETWFEGEYQKSFSYEIVSLEGYTQFLIRTPEEYRNLIETSVYAQYPDAEISEVDDYTQTVPQRWPDEEYDLWGAEFIPQTDWVYPIKCYREFEHMMGPSETQFKDPMASLMDLCGSLRQGEQFWMQIVVKPTGFDWPEKSEKEIDKILGRKKKYGSGLVGKGLEALGDVSEIIYPIWQDIDPAAKKEERPKSMMELTMREKRQVEGIEMKAAQLGFEAKVRVVYLAKKEVMQRSKVVNGFVGYIKQFLAMDLNGFKPDLNVTATRTAYMWKQSRLLTKKRKIFNNYVKRDTTAGRRMFILNIEELATIWHFPLEANVKAAMVQKAPGRKADAPSALPLAPEKTEAAPDIFRLDANGQYSDKQPSNAASGELSKDSAPPPNLPTI